MSTQPFDEPGVSFRFGGRDGGNIPDEPGHVPTAGDLLRQWREAERNQAKLEPGTPAWAHLKGEIERLRASYQEAFDALSNSDPSESSA